ncbi:MAG: hypothetical protein Q8S73_44855 [Deltaproteobacteria bacterium]|nr:hypothetical protein [Myxococcales bacterium]MDP3221297.1 hypothetical protein [Deltaproteobacteria bacterium]
MRTPAVFSVIALASLAAACGPIPGDAPAPEGCPVITNTTPTTHPLSIEQSETWTAAASPHVVQGDTRLAEGATLTIEPCARVVFRADASLTLARANTRLVAEGTASRPISFTGLSGARWGQLKVEGPARASLRYVSFADGGADRFHSNASLVLRGDLTLPAKPVALLDHVTITDSFGPGVVVERAGTFAPGSTDLVVTRSGSEAIPFPVVIGEHAIDGLPAGTYTGNRADEILVDPEGANGRGGLQADSTMRDRGVPYRIGDSRVDRFVIGAGGREAPGRTTLTVEPGVVMRFHPGTRFEVEHYTGDFAASGVLRAVGTAARPIVITSAAPAPSAGDWSGLWYGGIPSADNRLEHVSVEYTGGDCGCVLATCSDVARHDAAIIFSQPPASAFVRNTRIAHGRGHGVFRGWRGASTPDFMDSNTFEDLAGCAQTLPSREPGCGPLQACR